VNEIEQNRLFANASISGAVDICSATVRSKGIDKELSSLRSSRSERGNTGIMGLGRMGHWFIDKVLLDIEVSDVKR